MYTFRLSVSSNTARAASPFGVAMFLLSGYSRFDFFPATVAAWDDCVGWDLTEVHQPEIGADLAKNFLNPKQAPIQQLHRGAAIGDEGRTVGCRFDLRTPLAGYTYKGRFRVVDDGQFLQISL